VKIHWLIIGLLVTACEQPTSVDKNPVAQQIRQKAVISDTGRWYSSDQLVLGQRVFQKNCQICHKENAAGTRNWKKTLPDGNYPPPPLNGTAHAWHHDMATLSRTIKNGGIPLGGVMPGFANKLSDKEIQAVIAYFQSFWSQDIYNAWLENGGLEVQ